MVIRVPFAGGEKESLHSSLRRHRDVVLWKVEGLDDERLRRPMTPSGTSLLGLVKHLASVEYSWFCQTFGRETEPLPFRDDDPDADLRVDPDESTASIIDFYGRARAAADRVIDEVDLDDLGTAWSGDRVSMRWVLIHMIEETARHAGHMDILRELLDGATGDHRPDGVRLRPARAADAAAIAQVWYEGWGDGHLGHVPEELVAVRTRESFEQRAAQRIGDTVVATAGEAVAGFVMVAGDEVEQVYVAAPHRGTAVAAALLAEAERLVAAGGNEHAWLAVVDGNARARRFYERSGWADGGPFDYPATSETGTIPVPARRYTKRVSGQD
jgi:GNAT superfamily N-acetyltransferase